MNHKQLDPMSHTSSPSTLVVSRRRGEIGAAVLVVHPDHDVRGLLAGVLRAEGHAIYTATDAASALSDSIPLAHAVVVAVDLPDRDGRDVCRALRRRDSDVPIIVLGTGRRRGLVTEELLSAFAAGADDYLTFPYIPQVLVARVRVLLRRSGRSLAIEVGDLKLDPTNLEISSGGVPVQLSPTEFRLLASLLAHSGAIVSRRQLVSAGWPTGAFVADNSLDQYMAKLRRKIRLTGSRSTIMCTRNVGYRLRTEAEDVGSPVATQHRE